MQALNTSGSRSMVGLLIVCTLLGCSSSQDGEDLHETRVTLVGRVDDGTAASSIANAVCQFVLRSGTPLAGATADRRGTFRLDVLPEVEGFIRCSPSDFPNLVLVTFMSTVGVPEGATVPTTGFEEISPRTTVVATIIAQTAPSDPQARKAELLAALAAQDPDLTMLTEAATALFNAMWEQQVGEVSFGSESGEGSGNSGSDDSGGGVEGDAGDGAEFSPLANVPCEFVLTPEGDSALEDLLVDGVLDRPDLQTIATDVAQDGAIAVAFARLFPTGIQPHASNGQPLWTTTERNGRYFLPVPPVTPGFVRCTPTPQLAISTVVEARQAGEILMEQHVSPANQFFAAFLFPLLPQQDVHAIEANFLTDIGDLGRPIDGIVRVETIASPQGRMIADTDDDGVVCSLLEGIEEAAIQYPAAAAAAYTATALFKALLIEARSPAVASYETILADVLLRTTATGIPQLEILDTDLIAGGVLEERAPELTALLNSCIRTGVERTLGIPLLRMVRAGRLRLIVRDAQGTPLPRAQATVEGAMILFGSRCESQDHQMVCSTDEQGRVTIVLQGEISLAVTLVHLLVASEDGTLTSQVQVDFLPPTTRDIAVTVHPR
jgi:hypothetical protein